MTRAQIIGELKYIYDFVDGVPAIGRLIEKLSSEANVGDEITDANVVRLWRDPKTGKWHGLLGPNDWRGLHVDTAIGPQAVLRIMALKSEDWPFDQSAPGPVIEIPSGVDG